jgi:hypothetical protein
VRALDVAILVIALGVVVPQAGHADEIGLHLQVKLPDRTSKSKDDAPMIEATIVDGPNVPLDKLTLREDGEAIAMKAIAKRAYEEGTETLALAFVMSGQTIWIGTEDIAREDGERYEGVLKTLASSIDRLRLGALGPSGSKGLVITYAQGARVRLAASPLEELTGAAFGSQTDYADETTNDLVQGVTLAMSELGKLTTVRKVLLVIGDGHDTNDDVAKTQLAALRKEAARQGIEVFAITYHSAITLPGPGPISTLTPNVKTANSVLGIGAELTAVVDRLRNRYYVTFAGYDKLRKQGLRWDGQVHDLVVTIDRRELTAFPLVLAPAWKPFRPAKPFPWLLAAALAGAALLLAGVAIKRRRPRVVAAPIVYAAPPDAVIEAPHVPVKTGMLSAGGAEDGFPMVAWLVPLNGPAAFQTFRIRLHGSKIGTAPPADVIINDGFASTHHAQLTCSPAGFTLIDEGSTNGCYVNDIKVARHELVDNDVITIGKTELRFKTIN